MASRLLFGVVMVAVSIAMLLGARPRQGAVVGFLRGRDGLQSIYATALILLFVSGVVAMLSSWR